MICFLEPDAYLYGSDWGLTPDIPALFECVVCYKKFKSKFTLECHNTGIRHIWIAINKSKLSKKMEHYMKGNKWSFILFGIYDPEFLYFTTTLWNYLNNFEQFPRISFIYFSNLVIQF